METTEKTWLTRREAAQRAGVGLRTIARRLADGKLTRHRDELTRRVLIDADELDAVRKPTPAPERTVS